MNIFIATPMSGFNNYEYKSLQDNLLNIKEYSENTIYSEITEVEDSLSFLSPMSSAKRDIEYIENCEKFILI